MEFVWGKTEGKKGRIVVGGWLQTLLLGGHGNFTSWLEGHTDTENSYIFFCLLNCTVASCLHVARCNSSSTGITGFGFGCGTVHSHGHTLWPMHCSPAPPLPKGVIAAKGVSSSPCNSYLIDSIRVHKCSLLTTLRKPVRLLRFA